MKKIGAFVSVLLLTGVAACPAGAEAPREDAKSTTDPRGVSTEALIAVLSGESDDCRSIAEAARSAECLAAAEAELVRKKATTELIAAAEDDGWAPRAYWTIRVLEQIGGPTVESALYAFSQQPPSPHSFYAALHFARACAEPQLAYLQAHFEEFGLPSYVIAEALDEFGRCKYKPAIPFLVGILPSASFNITLAACHSLRVLAPDGPTCDAEKESPDEIQTNWSAWLRRVQAP